MNSFGRIFRSTIFGESHGDVVGICIDGCPPGIAVDASDFVSDIERRKGGLQTGTTPRTEADTPIITTGIFNGFSTGAPITILFKNENRRSADYDQQKQIPRPGHADWIASKKFDGFNDYRGGGHFSGRLTVALVAAGVIAKKCLAKRYPSMRVTAVVTEVGGEHDIAVGVQRAVAANDSVGGIVRCEVSGLPAALGEPFFDSVESLIAHAVFAIPAIKGIEFGSGFASAKMFGSSHNDSILNKDGKTSTNYAGGINGGITNGNNLIFSVAVKPASSTPQQQESYNMMSEKKEKFNIQGRHDLCIALRVPVVVEAVTAMVLADLLLMETSVKNLL